MKNLDHVYENGYYEFEKGVIFNTGNIFKIEKIIQIN